MELTVEEKDQLINARLSQYQRQIFQLQMDCTALEAVGDSEGVEATRKRIEALEKAQVAVEGMRVYADT